MSSTTEKSVGIVRPAICIYIHQHFKILRPGVIVRCWQGPGQFNFLECERRRAFESLDEERKDEQEEYING
jgi:hypothetical protein